MHLVVCNAPKDRSRAIARALIQQKLAASVNLLPGVLTFLYWKERYVEDDEDIILVKTPSENLDAVMAKLNEMHPYKMGEIYALEVDKVQEDYQAWLASKALPEA